MSGRASGVGRRICPPAESLMKGASVGRKPRTNTMPQSRLHSVAITRIQTGALPPVACPSCYAGPGGKECCAVCAAPITQEQIEYEISPRLDVSLRAPLFFPFAVLPAAMHPVALKLLQRFLREVADSRRHRPVPLFAMMN